MSNPRDWQDVARVSHVAHDIREAPKFAGAKAKILRAKQHWHEIKQIITDHLSGDWYTIERFDDDGVPTIKIELFPPGFDLSVAIGDYVHNLRSALDHLAVACVELNDGNPKDVHFPFAPEESQLETSIRKAKFHRASSDAVDLLLSYKPYRGGNVALRALHDLDVADKHRALVPAVGSTSISGSLNPARSISSEDFKVETPRLVFQQKGPLGGEEILPTLESLFHLVEGIVDAFETLLVPSSPS